MATFTSKTLIPGQTPVGQNRDGSYIYEEVMSKATTAPKPITPIYTPPTAIPMVKSPLGFNTVPQVDKQVAQKVNAPVKDTLGLNSKIDSTSERTTQLRSHFSYLEDKGELFLNDKQSDYIKRFKTKYPDYQNVPDAILYGKVILADPKTMEKYGNIGEKTFLQRLGKATFGSLIDTVEATQEGVQAYKDYNVKGGGAMNEGVAIASGLGKFVGDTFTNVGANLINLGVPKKDNLKGATSSSELLGKNVAETLQSLGNFAKTGIDWFKGEGWTENIIQNITESIQSNPEAQKEFQAAMNILNILPGGFANKSAKALTAKQVLKNIARDAELTVGKKGLFGTATKEAFDAGMSRGIVGGIETGVNSTIKASDDWIKKQAEILSRNIPASEQAPSSFEKLKKASAEKIMAKQWKIRPNIRRDIRQKTGMSAEEFALSNNLVGKDIEESLARANAFKDIKMSEKADLISEWGTAPKTPAQDAMAASLKKNLEGSLSDVAGANDPELVALLKGVDDFIKADKTTYQQIDALKSLYDHYNPDNLSWDAQGRLVNPTAHQNAAYRRSEVQKMIEAEGEKRGVDIKQINKDIRGSHDLSKGLAAAEERMANNNIISLGDTQIAIMGSLLGGDIAGVGTLAVKKMLGSESATSFLARKLYNTSNDKVNPLNLSGGTSPINRVGRFTGDSGTSPDISSELATPKSVTPVVSGPGQSLAVSIDNGTIDVKKALEQFDKLTPEEKAKALQGSDKLRTYTEARDISKVISKKMFTPEEKAAKMEELKRIVDRSSMEELEVLADFDKNIDEAIGKIRAGENPIEVTETPKTKPTTNETTPKVETPNSKRALPMSQKSDVGKTDDYFYHGTSQGAFEQIQKEGIKPQRRGVSSFSKTEEYSRNWAYPEATGVKGAMLRVKKSYMEGKLFNTKKPRPKSDELYEVLTKETIPPEALEVLKDGKWQPLVKPKPSLPLSSKSEVKYSDTLESEAKNYKSADDFIKAQEGSMYFHGTNVDFKKPDVSKVGTGEGSIMAGKGFNLTSLSSDAKNYAYQVSQKKGGKEVILGTKIDKNKMNLFDADKMDKDVKMQSEIIDFILKKQNEFKGLTKDKIIGKLDDKWTGDFMGLIEEEYGFAKYVDDFIKSKGFDGVITKERTSQKWGKIRPENITIFNPKDIEMVNLIDIYNKANKKSALPLSQKSEVKYSDSIEEQTIIYHGSPFKFEEFKNRTTFFTTDKEFARRYSDSKSFAKKSDAETNIYERVLPKDAKMFRVNDVKSIEKYLPENEGRYTKEEIKNGLQGFEIVKPKKEYLEAKIGDNVDYDGETYFIFRKDKENIYGKDYRGREKAIPIKEYKEPVQSWVYFEMPGVQKAIKKAGYDGYFTKEKYAGLDDTETIAIFNPNILGKKNTKAKSEVKYSKPTDNFNKLVKNVMTDRRTLEPISTVGNMFDNAKIKDYVSDIKDIPIFTVKRGEIEGNGVFRVVDGKPRILISSEVTDIEGTLAEEIVHAKQWKAGRVKSRSIDDTEKFAVSGRKFLSELMRKETGGIDPKTF